MIRRCMAHWRDPPCLRGLMEPVCLGIRPRNAAAPRGGSTFLNCNVRMLGRLGGCRRNAFDRRNSRTNAAQQRWNQDRGRPSRDAWRAT